MSTFNKYSPECLPSWELKTNTIFLRKIAAEYPKSSIELINPVLEAIYFKSEFYDRQLMPHLIDNLSWPFLEYRNDFEIKIYCLFNQFEITVIENTKKYTKRAA